MNRFFLFLTAIFTALISGSAFSFDNADIFVFSHPQPDAISKSCKAIVRVVNEADSDDPFTGILSASCEGERIVIEAVGFEPVRKKTFVFKVYDTNLNYCDYVSNVSRDINQLRSLDGTITASVSHCTSGGYAIVKITVIRVR